MTLLHSNQTLTLRQAAQVIFATRSPAPLQVAQVQRCVERGMLKGAPARGPLVPWTTTPDSVAEFMASRAYRDQFRPSAAPCAARLAQSGDHTSRADDYQQLLVGVYRQALVDRLLEVVVCRSRRLGCGSWWRGAAVAAVVLLMTTLGLAAYGIQRARQGASERAAVVAWLGQNAPEYRVLRWYPPAAETDDRPASIRVHYSYRRGGKLIEADQLFQMQRGRMTPGSDADDDASAVRKTVRAASAPARKMLPTSNPAPAAAVPRVEWD